MREDSNAWREELPQRMSLLVEVAGQVPSESWMEPAPVDDSTMAPRNVAVALKVVAPLKLWAADQVTEEAAVTKPGFVKV